MENMNIETEDKLFQCGYENKYIFMDGNATWKMHAGYLADFVCRKFNCEVIQTGLGLIIYIQNDDYQRLIDEFNLKSIILSQIPIKLRTSIEIINTVYEFIIMDCISKGKSEIQK